jgi:hypothetical protein
LRIAAEHAGKQVRCPACQQISAAPSAPADRPPFERPFAEQTPAATPDHPSTWHVRTPEGTVYGPIRWSELLTWVTEGRVAADCELASSAQGPWQQAGDLVPVLRSPVPAPAPSSQPNQPAFATSAAPASPPSYPAQPYAPSYLAPGVAPHRGALVLVFGVLGIVVGCPVFSVLAWILGSRDIREMRAGRMDRQGEAITQVGMILGMIISIIWLASTFVALTILLIAIAARF